MRREIGTMTTEEINSITGFTRERIDLGNSEQVRAALIEDVTGETVAVDDFQLSKGTRIDIQRSDEFNNKRRKLRKGLPEASMFEIDLPFPLQGEKTLVYRTAPGEPLREVFPGGEASFTTAIAAEPEKVLAPLVGQAALGPAGMIAGSIASPFIEKAIEKRRGFREGSLSGSAVEGSLDAALNTGADIATRGVTRLLRGGLAKSAGGKAREGIVELLPDSGRVIAAQAEEGFAPLASGQLARSPTTQAIFQQVTAITRRGGEFLNKQQQALHDNIQKKTLQTGPDGLSDAELGVLVDGKRGIINKQIATLPQGTDTGGGQALQEGGQAFKSRTSQLGGRLYKRAFDISEAEDLSFDISETVSLGKKMQEGVKAMGKEVTENVDTGLLDDAGKPITRQETTRELVNVREKLATDINDVVADLEALDPELRTIDTLGGKSLAAKQIQALRTRLFDIRQRAEGEVMGKLANDLWSSFTTAMSNPVSGSPAFNQAWRKANTFWRFRENELDKGAMATLVKTLNPEALFRSFGRPGNFDALQKTKSLIPRAQWNNFRESFIGELQNKSPTELRTTLANLGKDKRSQALLIKPAERKALMNWATQIDQLDKGVLNKLSTEDVANVSRGYEIAKNTTQANMAEQIKRAGGKKSRFATSVRAGLYEHVLKVSEDIDRAGNPIIDPRKFEKVIKEVLSFEAAPEILGPEGMRHFTNLELYSNVIKQTSDVGVSLIRQNIASGLSTPTQPGKVIKAARKVFDKRLWGLVLAQPVSHKGILRANKLPVGSEKMRMLGIAVASATNAYNEGTKGRVDKTRNQIRNTTDNILNRIPEAAP
jgi:hypothetical protein